MTTKQTDDVALYEDNAGQLTIEHRDTVYRGLEQLTDGSTLASLSAIMADDADGDLSHFVSGRPVTDNDILITIRDAGGVHIHGAPGLAACRLIGVGA